MCFIYFILAIASFIFAIFTMMGFTEADNFKLTILLATIGILCINLAKKDDIL